MDDVTHAGHPLDHHRWCVNEQCNRLAVETQSRLREDTE